VHLALRVPAQRRPDIPEKELTMLFTRTKSNQL